MYFTKVKDTLIADTEVHFHTNNTNNGDPNEQIDQIEEYHMTITANQIKEHLRTATANNLQILVEDGAKSLLESQLASSRYGNNGMCLQGELPHLVLINKKVCNINHITD